jgi:hypothetical protein
MPQGSEPDAAVLALVLLVIPAIYIGVAGVIYGVAWRAGLRGLVPAMLVVLCIVFVGLRLSAWPLSPGEWRFAAECAAGWMVAAAAGLAHRALARDGAGPATPAADSKDGKPGRGPARSSMPR